MITMTIMKPKNVVLLLRRKSWVQIHRSKNFAKNLLCIDPDGSTVWKFLDEPNHGHTSKASDDGQNWIDFGLWHASSYGVLKHIHFKVNLRKGLQLKSIENILVQSQKIHTRCWTVAVMLFMHQLFLQLFNLWSLWIIHRRRNPFWSFRMRFGTSFSISKRLKGRYSRTMKARHRVALRCTDFFDFISKKSCFYPYNA